MFEGGRLRRAGDSEDQEDRFDEWEAVQDERLAGGWKTEPDDSDDLQLFESVRQGQSRPMFLCPGAGAKKVPDMRRSNGAAGRLTVDSVKI